MNGDYENFLKLCAEDTQWQFMSDGTLNKPAELRAFMIRPTIPE